MAEDSAAAAVGRALWPDAGEMIAEADRLIAEQRENDIRLVCEVAFDWAGEYGFSDPVEATRIWNAAVRLCSSACPEQPALLSLESAQTPSGEGE